MWKHLPGGLLMVALLLGGLSCTSTEPPEGAETPRRHLFRAHAGEDLVAGEGDTVTLRASAVNGTAPFIFRWNLERQPDPAAEVGLTNATSAEAGAGPLTVQGRYVFRVVVVDASGRDAYSFVVVDVGPPGTGTITGLNVSIEGPRTVAAGEPADYRAIVEEEGDFTYLWEVVEGGGVRVDHPREPTLRITLLEPSTVVIRVTVKDEAAHAAGAAEWTIEAVSEDALAVSISGPTSVEVDEVIELTASVVNSNGEVTYAWTVTDGEAELTNADSRTVSVRPTAVGRLAVHVEVTRASDGETTTGEYVVTVSSSTYPLTLRTSVPEILRVGNVGTLSVSVEDEEHFHSVSYAWEVVAGEATLSAPASAETELRVTQGETIHLRVTATATEDEGTRAGEEEVYIVTYLAERPEVVLTITSYGEIVFELRPDVSPKTVANFLRYVDEGFYDGLLIHRVVPDFVIQGGGYRPQADGTFEQVEVRDPVPSEATNGLSNVRGTVAMALRGSDVNSGTSQWFISLVDNDGSGSTNLDTMGFTVFASVTEGMDVVDTIGTLQTGARGGLPGDVPVEDVIMESARRRGETP